MSRLDRQTWSDGYPNAPGHVHGSNTSRAAAHSMRPKMGFLHEITLRAFREAGQAGLTDEQLDRDWCVRANYAKTLRPRRIELTALRHLKDSGRTATTVSGRQAKVWVTAT
jgi:hypothetical protein